MRLLLPLLLQISSLNAYSEIESDEGQGQDEEPEKQQNATFAEDMTSIDEHIFVTNKYNWNRRPVQEAARPLHVSIHLHVMHVSVDQSQQTLTMHGHLYMSWMDEFAGWPAARFNGVRMTHVLPHRLWTPKIRVVNGVSGVRSGLDIARAGHILLQTQEDDTSARAEMYPNFSIRVGCDFDFSSFPWDEHTCHISLHALQRMDEVVLTWLNRQEPTMILSWANGSEQKKTVISDFSIESITNNISFVRMMDGQGGRNAGPLRGTWTVATTAIRLRRHAPLFGAVAALPLFVCSILCVLSLLVHEDLLLALRVNVINIIVCIAFLHDFIGRVPRTVSSTPKAVRFYGVVLSVTAALAASHSLLLALASSGPRRRDALAAIERARAKMPFMNGAGGQDGCANEEFQTDEKWKSIVTKWRRRAAILLAVFFSVEMFYSFLF